MTPLFHLWIRSIPQEQYRVEAEYEEIPRVEAITRFASSDAFQTNLSKLTTRIPGARPPNIDAQLQICRLIGQELFTAFFTGPVLNLFRDYRAQNDSPRIALHIPRDLYYLPWEMLRDPQDTPSTGDFLVLFGSIVRYDADATDYDPISKRYTLSDSLTSLFLSPRPNATPEEDAVPEIVFESTTRIIYDDVGRGTYSNFLHRINRSDFRPSAFIFFGHGRIENNIGKLVFVVMQGLFARTPIGEARVASDVARPLATKNMLRFSCVMACETAWCDRGMTFENTVAGHLLLNTSLAFVVGAQLKMSFPAAQEFLTQMMRALQGEEDHLPDPIDLVLKQSRQAVLALAHPACLDWWVPVIYAKSTTLALLAKPKIEIPTISRDI